MKLTHIWATPFLHCIESIFVFAANFFDEKNFAKGSLAEDFEQGKVRCVDFLVVQLKVLNVHQVRVVGLHRGGGELVQRQGLNRPRRRQRPICVVIQGHLKETEIRSGLLSEQKC